MTTPGAASASRRLRALITGLLAIGLLVFAARDVQVDGLRQLGAGLRWQWVIVAVALVPVQVVLAASRWRAVAWSLDQPLTAGRAIREYALSTLVNLVLPIGVAGDGLRVWRQRKHASLAGALRAAVIERWSGQALLGLLVVAGVVTWTWLSPDVSRPGGAQVLAAGAAGALLALPLLPESTPLLGTLARDTRVALRRAAGPLMGLGVALLVAILAGVHACAFALGRPLGVELWLAVPLILMAGAIPLGLGGWGPREVGAVTVLPLFGWSPTEAFALTGLLGMTFLVGALPGALALIEVDGGG